MSEEQGFEPKSQPYPDVRSSSVTDHDLSAYKAAVDIFRCRASNSDMRILWLLLGLVSLALGFIGIFLPLLPTTPFLLLSAFCFARSSDRLHRWLLAHPVFGSLIENWQKHHAIARSAKIAATVGCAAVFAISLMLNVPVIGLFLQAFVLVCVLAFIWTRAEPV